jgi:hypothetical protein|tara:strand:+ start:1782 stop:2258 length:477 start_codon:yes stop_codon:yes gene_type:complete
MNKRSLEEFLQKAKKKTFASVITLPRINFDKSKEYIYKEGNWIYKDKYFGSIVDTGQELVFYKERLVWSMSYRGGMIAGKENLSRKCFSFLKQCLRNAPLEFPVRGPINYKKGNFKYENSWKGNIEDFVGGETIFLNGEQIYFRNYLGGMGKPREINY